ncbi:OmpA family protein [Pseudofulvibacter geojedonensis]|uniref:OmpA family protein n=1 Tax=Pseudofulvibacter geojedonensis TaxID=1123758 RepID=A0ABW3I6K5_9FLAO
MMKTTLFSTLFFFFSLLTFAQDNNQNTDTETVSINNVETPEVTVLTANFQFDVTDTGVNSKQNEYGSGFFKQKYIIISAKKIGGLGGTKDPLTGEPHTQIYCSTIKKTGNLDNPTLYSRILNTHDNEGSITFTPDERTVYYTRSILNDSIHNYQLFRARDAEGNGQWLGEEKIDLSSNNYNIENPYMTNDGKKLYFTSDMPGGFGGFDIYYADVNADGSVGKPINLGKGVNTPNNERTPYIDSKNKYLYFASDGHNTIGGLDVFRARNVNGTFVRPLNLGPTINSDQDDYAFMMANSKRGYVTSAKANGVGGSDIYKVILNYNKQSIRGTVKDALTKLNAPNTVVEVIDQDGNIITTKKVGKDAKFSVYVDPYEVYTIRSNKEGYIENIMDVETNSATDRYFDIEVNLEQTQPEIVEEGDKTMIKIENIYFDFDRATIKDDSKISLDKIVRVLEDNPDMKIEVNAHTDIRGSAAYNLGLSKRRAASAMKYLISRGVNADRLISEGFGETQTIIDCISKECSDEEHELNRRIEFVVIK